MEIHNKKLVTSVQTCLKSRPVLFMCKNKHVKHTAHFINRRTSQSVTLLRKWCYWIISRGIVSRDPVSTQHVLTHSCTCLHVTYLTLHRAGIHRPWEKRAELTWSAVKTSSSPIYGTETWLSSVHILLAVSVKTI